MENTLRLAFGTRDHRTPVDPQHEGRKLFSQSNMLKMFSPNPPAPQFGVVIEQLSRLFPFLTRLAAGGRGLALAGMSEGIYPAVLGVVVKLTITGAATFRANLEKLR